MSSGLRPAVFLDRDGTLIADRHYLSDPAEVELLPGVVEALRALRAAGLLLVVVTNQSGIARGLFSEEDYRAVAARLERLLAAEGVAPDATKHCPHHPDHGGPCACRKPATGMYLEAAADLGIDPAASWYVGDKVSDVVPARELGGRGILLRTGHGRAQEAHLPPGVAVVDDLAGAAAEILASR